MQLSIVIVNYNVKHFLEQCLKSVFQALEGIEAEVWVVDNHSVDGSVAMVQRQFPQVKLIENQDNPGFSRANNQALRQAQGKYVLLLNPDTVVQEDTFTRSIAFLEDHPDAGGLGIRMLDGRGRYLPESKRGLPTPGVALAKLSGLSGLFPRSRRLAYYYMGHLNPHENQRVEVLAGAYLMMPRKVLEKVGSLDEDYFMYGEDIDLSYRLLKAGYQNYYLADSQIIHYKGESTKKGSLNYVRVFYGAMVIFAQKHFGQRYARLFGAVIQLGIYLRAFLAFLQRLGQRLAAPLLDAGFLLAGLLYITNYWEENHRFVRGGEYPDELLQWAFPAYIAFWLVACFLSGVYDRRPRLSQVLRGIFFGTVGILVVYSLLPENYRFSRAIIVLGAFFAGLALPAWRYLAYRLVGWPDLSLQQGAWRRLIVGEPEELRRVEQLIRESDPQSGFIGWVSTAPQSDERFTGSMDDLPALCRVFGIQEVVFCSLNVRSERIFRELQRLREVEVKIAPPSSSFIIGSNAIHAPEGWYAMRFNAISKSTNRRAKRLFDLGLALGVLLLGPLLMWFMQRPVGLWQMGALCLLGKRTWVGYHPGGYTEALPALPPAVIPVGGRQPMESHHLRKLNLLYAKDYRLGNDFYILARHWRQMGGKPQRA
jgi:GT2 family glycosyltransferase